MYSMSEIVKLYVFGSATPPQDLNDRVGDPSRGEPTKTYNAAEYMTEGAGRYALVGLFPIVQKFFDSTTIPPGSYPLGQILTMLGLSASSLELGISNYGTDILSGDFALRSFIFGGADFKLDTNATFHVDVDGIKSISNVHVFPKPETENFDFLGSNPLVNLLAEAPLEAALDPYGNGKTVHIAFEGDGVKYSTYVKSQSKHTPFRVQHSLLRRILYDGIA